MRLKNSSYNVFFNILQLLITTILTFVTRTLFIRYLGKEMLGLDGLFTNILSMLSLTELGIGTAISFSLYKPLADGDKSKVSSLITLYKKIYHLVAVVVLIIGLVLLPLLPVLSKGYTDNNIYLYYVVYLINTVFTYLLSYKETLIIADQKNYKLFWNRFVFILILYLSQIIILITTHSFLYYIIAMLICNFSINLVNNIYVSKLYPDIDFSSKDKVDEKTRNVLFQNAKNMLISKVGDYLLNGTDNIIISTIDITLTGIYSNYLAIVGVMKTFINAIYNGITASFGNVMVTEKQEVQENVFSISVFICFLISSFITIEMIFIFNPFIGIWAGKDYLVEFWVSVVIALNFYFYCNFVSLNNLKISSGKYKADRFVPIIQAIVNLIVSIVLGHFMGLSGVILGTLVSYLTVGFIFRPVFLIKNIFNKSSNEYFFNQFIYILFNFIIVCLLQCIFSFISLNSGILLILIKALIVLLVYVLGIILVFRKNKSFLYIISKLKKNNTEE